MARFGSYIAVRQLYRTGFAGVYTGRRAEQTAEEFAIKVCRPSVHLGEQEHATRQLDAFADSARIQGQAGAVDPSHWAPVHAEGMAEEGAFYVTDLCRSSLRQLIDGRLHVAGADLRNIITSVVQGLVALKKACNRPHGNLKPSNVLIASVAPLPKAKIVLCDPLPGEYIDPETHWAADLREVAELIYQLVMHEPTPVTKGWQIPESDQWKRLEKQRDYWRNLCNRLLTLEVQPDAVTLEGLAEELDALPSPRPPVSRYVLLGGAGAALLVVTALLLLNRDDGLRDETFTRWCTVIQWIMPLGRELQYVDSRSAIADPDVRKIYKSDVEPVCETLGSAWWDPRDPAVSQLLREAAMEPLPTVADENWKKVIRRASSREVRDHMDRLEKFFFNAGQKYEYWPWLRELRGAVATAFKDLHESSGSEYVAAVIEDLERLYDGIDPNQPGRLGKNVIAVLDFKARWEALDLRLGQLDPKALGEDPPDGGTEALRERLEKLKDYYREDPRDKRQQEWARQHRDIQEVIAQLREPELTREEAEGYAKRLSGVVDRYRLMPEHLAKEQVYFIKRDRQRAVAEVNDVMDDMTVLLTDVNRTLAKLQPPDQWLPNVRGWEITDSEVLQRHWVMRRDALLDDATAKRISTGDLRLFLDVRPKIEGGFAALQNLAKRLPNSREILQGRARSEYSKLEDARRRHTADAGDPVKPEEAYYQDREEVFRIITAGFSQRNVPDVNSPEFPQELAERLRVFGENTKELADLIELLPALHQNLNACYLPAEHEPTGNYAQKLAERLTVLRDEGNLSQVFSDESSIDKVSRWLESRLAKVTGLHTSVDPLALKEAALGADATNEVVYAAWRRLAELDTWLTTSQEWKDESAIRLELAGRVQSLEATRQGQLRREVASKSTGRYKAIIGRNHRSDGTLTKFDQLEPEFEAGETPDNRTTRMEDFERLAEDLARFGSDANWQGGRYDMNTFYAPNEQGSAFAAGVALTPEKMRTWLEQVDPNYLVLQEDPRDRTRWTAKARELGELIGKGLAEIGDEEDRLLLENDRNDVNQLDTDLESLMKVPAITKYAGDIDRWHRLWDVTVPGLEDQINSHITPRYCKYLEMSEGQVAFKADLGLGHFEPVQHPEFEPLSLASLRDFEKNVAVRDNFFEATEAGTAVHPNNVGWPKYIRFKPDESPGIHFRFIPGDATRGTPPFYMALHETTNAQYAKFLTESRATGGEYGLPATDSEGQNIWIAENQLHGVDQGRLRIGSGNQGFQPEEQYENHPAVWITYSGAEAYAKWIDPNVAQLPPASWHHHAAGYGEPTHWQVRTSLWAAAVDAWNSFLAQSPTMATQSPPLGAADQAYCDDASDPSKLASLQAISKDIDPTRESSARSPTYLPSPVLDEDRTELCDLIGNAWEWCTASAGSPVLCGGSCLSQPQMTKQDAELQYAADQSNRDVGFRVVVVPRTR